MQQCYPAALAYLTEFRERLIQRVAYRRYQSRAPFYSVYDVGPYTVVPTKVVWRRMDRRINAAVVELRDDPWLGPRPVIPQETCSLIAAASSDEAHYLCALLNSAVANFIACSHAVRGGKGFGTPGMLDYLQLRRFQPSDPRHLQLANLSRKAHASAASGEPLDDLQVAIDQVGADLSGLPAERNRKQFAAGVGAGLSHSDAVKNLRRTAMASRFFAALSSDERRLPQGKLRPRCAPNHSIWRRGQ